LSTRSRPILKAVVWRIHWLLEQIEELPDALIITQRAMASARPNVFRRECCGVPWAAAAPILSPLVTSVTYLSAIPRICFVWMWDSGRQLGLDLSQIALNIVANAFRR
jgi:hypothetical protein